MYKLLFLFIALNLGVRAQLKEGSLKYAVQITPIDTTEANLNAARAFRKSRMLISFDGKMYRIDSHLGAITNNSYIYNHTKKELLTLTSNGASKLAHKTIENIKPKIPETSDVKVTEYRDSIKKILQFECFYVELVDKGKTTSYWCTEDIEIEFRGKSIAHPSLPGFPLWFQVEKNGFQITYIAVNFVKEIDAELFSTDIPEGYIDVSDKTN